MDVEQKFALVSDNASLEPGEEVGAPALPACHTSNPYPSVPLVFGDPRNVEYKDRAGAAARPHSRPTGYDPKDISKIGRAHV